MIPMTSPAKLTDLQLAILSAASKREDRCLKAPSSLKGGAAQKVAAQLLTIGLVREIKAKAGMEAWRRDKETGQAHSLKLTAVGLRAIAVDGGGSRSIPGADGSTSTDEGPSKAKTAAKTPAALSIMVGPTPPAPRQGTKIARVLELLQRDEGAELGELIAATGWLPHTARAALTGLRNRGYEVRRERGESGSASVYRAVATPAAAS
jgi:hypothetical protein